MSDEHEKKIESQQAEERKQVEKEKEERQKVAQKERQETKKKYEEDMKEKEKKIKSTEKLRPYRTSTSMRLLNLIMGLVFMLLPAFILLNQDLIIDTSILIFAVIVGLSGFSRVINAFYDKQIGGTKRLIRFIIGSALIILALATFLFSSFGQQTLLYFIAIAIAIQGIGRIFLAIGHDAYPFWLKLTLLILGLVSIGIAVTAFTSFTLGNININKNNLVILFSAAFFVGGISRVGQSLAGLSQEKKS